MDESFDQIKREIIGEYERRNSKLSDCLKNMESIYEKQKNEYQRKVSSLEAEIKELRKKLELALSIGSKPKYKDEHEQPEGRRVKFSNTALVEELESKVKDLTAELQKKEELVGYRRKRDDWGRLKLEAEVKALRKKATVGWMLGSLWEVSLQADELGDGETSSIVRLLRKLQKDLERESVNATGSDVLDRDVQALLEKIESTLQKSGKVVVPSKLEPSRKDESSQASSPRLRGILTSPRSPRSPTSPNSPSKVLYCKHGNRDGSPVKTVHVSAEESQPASPPKVVVPCCKHGNRESSSPVKTPPGHVSDDPPKLSCFKLQHHGNRETSPVKPDSPLLESHTGLPVSTAGIRQMLSNIDANIKMLLESERRRGVKAVSDSPSKTSAWKK